MIRTFLAASALALTAAAGLAHAAQFTDPQIAHIAYTAGQLDVTAAEQALAKTQNPDVKAFAELMARDHAAVNEQALALVKKLNVTPEDNDTSRALVAQAADATARLDALSGAEFDKAYVENEVAYHKAVNAALRDGLIPAAHDPELKALLETGLALFEEHQAHAEMLEQSVK